MQRAKAISPLWDVDAADGLDELRSVVVAPSCAT
jgi:hypothetical protein